MFHFGKNDACYIIQGFCIKSEGKTAALTPIFVSNEQQKI